MCPSIVFVVQVLDEICPLIAIATFGCAGVAQRGVGGSEHLLGNEGNLQASKIAKLVYICQSKQVLTSKSSNTWTYSKQGLTTSDPSSEVTPL